VSCGELEGIERESENERNWRERRGRVGRDLREKVFGMKENKKAGERKESRKRGKQRTETRREFSSDIDVEGSTYKNFTHYNTIFVFFLSFFFYFYYRIFPYLIQY